MPLGLVLPYSVGGDFIIVDSPFYYCKPYIPTVHSIELCDRLCSKA